MLLGKNGLQHTLTKKQPMSYCKTLLKIKEYKSQTFAKHVEQKGGLKAITTIMQYRLM